MSLCKQPWCCKCLSLNIRLFVTFFNANWEQRYKGPSSRAHSAINDEGGVTLSRDRHHLLDIFSRPNTTHTYRVRCPVHQVRTRTCTNSRTHTHTHTLHTVPQMAQLTCLFARLFSQSDTPYRRSFTVLDNIGQSRTGRASVAAGWNYYLFNLTKNRKKNIKTYKAAKKYLIPIFIFTSFLFFSIFDFYGIFFIFHFSVRFLSSSC